MTTLRQAIVHIVRGGGAQGARRIRAQWAYLAREGDVKLQRSERYGGLTLPFEQLDIWAGNWARQTGNYILGQHEAEGHQDLTTHIVVSFPPGTDAQLAYSAARDWAWAMFGSGNNGGEFDYVTAFHVDRPHPHLHVVVNRRSLRGEWLAISHRNLYLNYDSLREGLADAALRHGILLDASSREQRGLVGHGPTTEQFRQRLREAIAFQTHFNHGFDDVDIDDEGSLGRMANGPGATQGAATKVLLPQDLGPVGTARAASHLETKRASVTSHDNQTSDQVVARLVQKNVLLGYDPSQVAFAGDDFDETGPGGRLDADAIGPCVQRPIADNLPSSHQELIARNLAQAQGREPLLTRGERIRQKIRQRNALGGQGAKGNP